MHDFYACPMCWCICLCCIQWLLPTLSHKTLLMWQDLTTTMAFIPTLMYSLNLAMPADTEQVASRAA